MSRYPNLNVNNEHQLIQRQQTFVLDRKLLTIHSEDRDVSKWPNSNYFEIDLPETLTNVESLRLVEIALPANYYNFSNNYQNTKLKFSLRPNNRSGTLPSQIYYALASNINVMYEITIQEGFFTPTQIATELQNKMNKAVTDFLVNDANISAAVYENFQVYYDEVGQEIYIGNNYDDFVLNFNVQIEYTFSPNISSTWCQQQSTIYYRYTKWGLPSYIGFEKEEYSTTQTTSGVDFDYAGYEWLTPDTTDLPSSQTAYSYYVKGPNTVCMFGESAIYMEVDKYNSMDELVPFSDNTNAMYNNDYNGTVNAAFAKIPITSLPNSQFFDSRNGLLQNFSHYNPPIDKIRKLKFKFRYHNGNLVDFGDCNFNFTISFNQLKDEIPRKYQLRIPEPYGL